MSLGVASAKREEPRAQITSALNKAIDNVEPLSRQLKIDNRIVPVADISSKVTEFAFQFSLMELAGLQWPSVPLNFQDIDIDMQNELVPIDLRDGNKGIKIDSRDDTNTIIHFAARNVHQTGLPIQYQDPKSAKKSFIKILSSFLFDRSAPDKNVNVIPPSEEFTVNTDEAGIQVLFATGYFISTRQGFGISTPAKRALHWGPYLFGWYNAGGAKFSDIIWTVPNQVEIYLDTKNG
ncbi:hypothetical protein ACLBXO_28670 [Methylobacterium sp. C33D]